MKYIFLMAGQGAQYPGMGRDLYEHSDEVVALFKKANAQVPFDLRALLFEGTAEELQSTDKTQIAITVVNIATALVLGSKGIHPHWLAGFSLGEYSAMVLAQVLTAEDACTAVKVRGECMEAASRAMDSADGSSGLVAVLGISTQEVQEAVTAGNISGAYVAIQNSPIQTVIGGTPAGLRAAVAACEEAGAMRIVPLKVSGPFHTPLMEEARINYQHELKSIEFRDPTLPIYSNVTGQIIGSGQEAKKLAVQQLVSPVLWTTEEKSVITDSSGHSRVALDVGPGNVLAGLWKAYAKRSAEETPACISVGTVAEIDNLVNKSK